jgi:hypothetical protein
MPPPAHDACIMRVPTSQQGCLDESTSRLAKEAVLQPRPKGLRPPQIVGSALEASEDEQHAPHSQGAERAPVAHSKATAQARRSDGMVSMSTAGTSCNRAATRTSQPSEMCLLGSPQNASDSQPTPVHAKPVSSLQQVLDKGAERGGRLHFVKFETSRVEDAIQFIERKGLHRAMNHSCGNLPGVLQACLPFVPQHKLDTSQ